MAELYVRAETRYGNPMYPRSRWKATVCASTFRVPPLERIPLNADSAAEFVFGSVRRSNV